MFLQTLFYAVLKVVLEQRNAQLIQREYSS